MSVPPLTALETAWDVDRHIVLESEDKVVLVRFSNYCASEGALEDDGGNSRARKRQKAEADQSSSSAAAIRSHPYYLDTQKMDEMLALASPKVRKFCTMYTVDTNKVPEFNQMYELGHDREPFAVMFFYRNVHIKVDVGTGNNNKINFFAFEGMDELIDIIEAVFRAGKIGKHMTSSERKYSTVSVQR